MPIQLNGTSYSLCREELIDTGRSISISRPEEIIDEVIAAVNRWMEFADEAGVKKDISQEIKNSSVNYDLQFYP